MDYRTVDDLRAMQSLPLKEKIGIAQNKIAEWYYRNNKMVYVSFSGGGG